MGLIPSPRSYRAPCSEPSAPVVAVAAPAVTMSARPAAHVASYASTMPVGDPRL